MLLDRFVSHKCPSFFTVSVAATAAAAAAAAAGQARFIFDKCSLINGTDDACDLPHQCVCAHCNRASALAKRTNGLFIATQILTFIRLSQ